MTMTGGVGADSVRRDLAMAGGVRYRVLLVDDEKLIRFTISSYLRKSNFEVTEAGSPEEAMSFVKHTHFDAIISDVMMGEIDGFVFRDMIRQFDTSVPVVFLTSMVNDYGNWLLEKISEDVRSYFLAKGVSRELMQFRLRQIIASYEQERESEQIKRDFDTGLEMASFVQHSLLPQWTDIDRVYHYGVAWRPLEKVSGDLYEWIRISRETALVIFGDVSGHGIRSALAMTAIQSFLKRFQEFDDHRASRVHAVARSIHEFIDANLRDIIYMAGIVIYVDFKNNRMRFINAGFPEVKCVSGTTGEFIPMNPENKGTIPFGLMHDAQYTADDVVELTFPDNAVFVLSTDGATDSSADPEGSQSVPEDVFDEVCSIAASADYQAGTVVQTSAVILKSLVEMGYCCQQDDRMIVSFCKAKHFPDRLIHEVEIAPEAIDLMAETMGMYATELTKDPSMSTKVQLLLEEFLMNVHRHGFEGRVRHHEYGVLMGSVVKGQFELVIWERGADYNALSKMSLEDTQQKLDERNRLFADSGRGTSIMRLISAGGVRHERISDLNKTTFRIPIGKGET